ncbi:hypothetical protein C8R47DRAFT_1317175 [Mycena vitilis]|nr:hypothetical protein C8R47DRAFT_1317175 [Mycena vitilis]
MSYASVVMQVDGEDISVPSATLTANCKLFVDLLSSPVTWLKEEDGAPVITIHDTREDVKFFVNALSVYGFFLPPPADPPPPERLLGVLRLADRYGALPLRRCALQHLESLFCDPCLSGYCEFRRTATDSDMALEGSCPLSHKTHRLRLLLAMITDIQSTECGRWLLPVLFYEVLRLLCPACEVSTNLDGIATNYQISVFDQAKHYIFPSHDREALQFLYEDIEERRMDMGAPGCSSPGECREACRKLATSFVRFGTLDLLIVREWEPDQLANMFCPTCLELRWEKRQDFLLNLWSELPVLFELPCWAKLIEERAEMMNRVV